MLQGEALHTVPSHGPRLVTLLVCQVLCSRVRGPASQPDGVSRVQLESSQTRELVEAGSQLAVGVSIDFGSEGSVQLMMKGWGAHTSAEYHVPSPPTIRRPEKMLYLKCSPSASGSVGVAAATEQRVRRPRGEK